MERNGWSKRLLGEDEDNKDNGPRALVAMIVTAIVTIAATALVILLVRHQWRTP